MRAQKLKAADIDAYIAAFPPAVRARLRKLRAAIRRAAPDAREKISYRIPTFALCGNLVHFAAYEHHIGLYPGASGVKKFARELGSYELAKGSVRFPHERPLPLELVAEIVKFRLAENLARYAPKAGAKPRSTRGNARRKARAT
jgi:uncharacterized protein YdhG (YjbR/CyaY superfamily)